MLPNPSTKRPIFKWFLIVTTVLIVQVLELLLLQRKYDLFTGGFLQPYSYHNLSDRLAFLGLSFWVDMAFFGTIGLVWFWLSRKRHVPLHVSAYNFIFTTIAAMGLWLAIKFKVLSYFNDTLNFLVIKNLGGGSLYEAFKYILDEAIIFGFGLMSLMLVYWLGLKVVKRRFADAGFQPDSKSRASNVKFVWPIFLLATIGLIAWINTVPSLRYGMSKKTSYALLSRALNTISDVDRDGYGLFRFPTDNNSLNADVHPGALDIPNNGIDEDGYGGDFLWSGKDIDPMEALTPRKGKHILLIVLESARGDLIGKKWKGKLVAPFMTGLANEGTSIRWAYSHTGYTTSSIKAIFNRSLAKTNDRMKLVDFLDMAGYQLSFISGQDESFGNVSTATGMNTKKHYFFDARSALEDRVFSSKDPGSLRLSEERIVQQFRKRISEVNWELPNFFYINLQAAHFPYSNPVMPMLLIKHPIARGDISADNKDFLQATYWNAIAVADDAVRKMVNALKQKGVYKDTIIMILGDHGESLFDDGFLGHGHALNETQTRIPLIINQPDLKIEQAVGQMDVAELITSLALSQFNATRWNNKQKSLLQVVGSLDTPQLVGTVAYGDVRTILDFRTRKVFFNDLEKWESFDQAIKNPKVAKRTRNLIESWEELRWLENLARRKKSNQ